MSDELSDPARLQPANPDDVRHTLSHALRYQGRRRVHTGDELMARIAAERLVEALDEAVSW